MTTPVEPARTPGIKGWLLRDLPYAAMLALAVGGIVLTSFRGATYVYWMTLAPVYALISIVSGWPKLDTGAERMKLVLTQALHWLAFLGAMWLMFLPEVRGVVNDNATALTLLILLALGTFVAGVHANVWRICAVGVFLALAVPAVAWIQESVMLLLVGALLLAAVGFAFWWMWRRESKRP
ncbi:MAG TPA: hypothetical protein VK777_12690 [Reyranella sp.]|nr:hypothetical protein [Reyranella sp.]